MTAIAGVHLLRGTPLGWLPVADVPVAVWAESEGAGDDVRLELSTAVSAEVQAKKGLNRGPALWDALEALITAIRDKHFDYGALAVAPNSSGTIREDLTKDLKRLGQGRSDQLTEIGSELHRRLLDIGGAWEQACQRVNIRVVHALSAENADIMAAIEALRWVCADESRAGAAWSALYRDAVALIEHRGRWAMTHLVGLLQRESIEIRDADFPAAISMKLADWVFSTRDCFTLPTARKRLPLSTLLEMRVVGTAIEQPNTEDAAEALARYHDAVGALERDAPIFDAEWTGRFRHRAVVVAGPGLGKSTLMTLLASSYASDGFPVLDVKLKPIAAAMARGDSFEHALRNQALDGSGITPECFNSAKLNDLVILVDGLDDCGGNHDAVARAIRAFASGHPTARIVVTTRPIGYTTAALADWKHYRLLPPDKNHGSAHLAKLLGALNDAEDSLQVAKHELAKSRAAEAISTSPHLLGMAAVLISSSGELPDTRPRLYSELIGLFETVGGAVVLRPSSSHIAAHVLNGLGWLLMQDSLVSADTLTERCAELLAEPMGSTKLAMTERVETVLCYWEQLGIIEQLHHNGTAYWTFVHKTFTEFTAARYLKDLPDEQRTKHLNLLVDQPDWHETIAFAGGLGLGDEIARLLVERRASGYSGQMERALAIAGDRDAEVTDGFVQQLTVLAFAAVQAEEEDRFSVGLALSDLAKIHSSIVGPIAAKYLHDERSAVKLVAWASVVSAEFGSYGADELAQVLSTLLPTISKSMSASLLGGLRLFSDKDRDLIECIALAALDAQPDANLKNFAETQLGHEAFGSLRFEGKVTTLLRARGIAEEVELPWRRSSALSAIAPLNTEEWRHASVSALRALAEAVLAESGEAGSAGPEPSRLYQFGALITLTGFNEVPAYDVYRWEGIYDATAVRTVVQALVHASAIDPQALSAEAATVVRWANAEDGFRPFDLDIPHVDVPEPDWHKAAALIPDRAMLVAGMNHGSIWMAFVAGNILAASTLTQEESRSLLNDAAGEASLWAATEVVQGQQSIDVANEVILDRLAGPLSSGAEYLFKGLEKGKVEFSLSLCEVIRRGLASESCEIASAAANLAKSLAERGQPLEVQDIIDAYDKWLDYESKYEGDATPSSPRETLLKLLIAQNAIDDNRLLATLADKQFGVCNVGKERVLDAIVMSESLRNTVIDRILSRSLPPAIAASVLQHETPISDEQTRALETLISEPDPAWRRVGVELLRQCYFGSDQIVEYCAKLSADDKDEIRRAAKQRLIDATT
ncbi:hypothetical protein BV504_09560 [Halomonas sp. 'Soap Lake |nr:hypothetical protein B2G49_09565 [Halomonas sp. 'Soap Lake \